METFLVGGAVRDTLLGLTVKDRDWVVVGAHPQQMLDLGYTQVGQDFPVFLHPETREEHALARTERKSGSGYTGFTVYAAPDVTLEQDLIRRDLTINAMAQDAKGNIHDPFNGQQDLEAKRLRHVSAAFSEDPLRVLRVARFAARYANLGFHVAPETLTLMIDMSVSGELSALTAERVWQEWHKSLTSERPDVFLETLRFSGALHVIMPEIDALFGVPQPEQHHPEIDCGIHTLLVAKQAATESDDPEVRFAAQLHDLGKGTTPKEEWPRHIAHEKRGIKLVKQLCHRLKVPNSYRDLALIVCAEHTNIHRAMELKPSTLTNLFDRIDAWRKPERVEKLVTACRADSRGRIGFEDNAYPQADYVLACFTAAQAVDVKPIVTAGYKGADIKAELNRQRAEAVASVKAQQVTD
ncbi:multifunctional CCA addition/repair protein [Thaumasiovibrio subtropicus]|uniref:multifunctional CCA addition/repair protein n=1 Tax=Thaumasiovibrio subtropicus TaxID=1891207 RepID=UPI000B34E867|nr:multifunctional CCA addition/repair protein [Thaumasiovibrio subtropicus]